MPKRRKFLIIFIAGAGDQVRRGIVADPFAAAMTRLSPAPTPIKTSGSGATLVYAVSTDDDVAQLAGKVTKVLAPVREINLAPEVRTGDVLIIVEASSSDSFYATGGLYSKVAGIT